MKRFSIATLCLLLVAPLLPKAQQVSNIHFEQAGKQIHIYYDLQGKGTYNVKVFCSTNNGQTWGEPLQKVTGAVGENQKPGTNKLIVWDVLTEREKLTGEIMFKITAVSKRRKKNKNDTETPGFWWGPTVMANNYSYSYSEDNWGGRIIDNQWGYKAGLVLDVYTTRLISFETGIIFKKNNLSFDSTFFYANYQTSANYLSVPLILKVGTVENSVGIHFDGGISLNILMSDDDLLNKTDVEFIVGFGFNFKLTNNKLMAVGVNLYHGVSNLINESIREDHSGSLETGSVSICLTLMFGH